jgi:D-aminopeptidase
MLGLARTGGYASNGSGDYVIAFSTATSVRIRHQSNERAETTARLREDSLSLLFQAVAEATEEAIYNSLLRATTVRGYRGNEAQALPLEELKPLLQKFGRKN